MKTNVTIALRCALAIGALACVSLLPATADQQAAVLIDLPGVGRISQIAPALRSALAGTELAVLSDDEKDVGEDFDDGR